MKKLISVLLLCVVSFAYAGVDEGMEAILKAAEQGNADAQLVVGDRYAYGKGVPQDYTQAIVWYTKAAEQWNASAQFHLAEMYALGQGVSQNDKIAYILSNLAASKGGDFIVSYRDIISKKLTPTARMDAQRISTQLYNSKKFATDLRKLLNAKQ